MKSTLYKRQITIFTNSSFKFIFFLKYFQENIFSDIKIKTKFRTNLKKNTSINFKSFSKSSTSLYLNYLDVFGELKF